ncbi:ABC transporter ATP-binding protein [Corynebacterium sp. TA-R-1]|uniref:ABC transporter ATP-binding protein n=1 Tax=Corynebacterium stercoris TaxID=2943490 RepID=A0ABT1FYF9_9CORY|nr:ABC transporter ATP-binding protein [Corynebacterium stercoris]MCP1386799.1 ABC transporter ATP-binding protein [Corynebacterium stercoris]
MITFENIKVVYDEFVAIPDFNLEIHEGEFFSFLGPSGCGKSTALRTLAGFIAPTSGSIRIDGKDVTYAHASKRGIGMVFQNYALFPSMNVRDNIEFGLKMQKLPKAEISERALKAARQVSLTDEQLGKQISELSGGQQQRVAIARALVMEPSILLLDEPLSNLDARLRKQLRVQLKEIQSEVGITTVYVTHDQEEALSMSDRIAVLNEGRIEQVGTPTELYEQSETEFVCNFLGEVNPLSDAQIHELNNQGARLSPEHSHYIRPERLTVQSDSMPAAGGDLRLPATIIGESYLGDHTVLEVDAMDTSLRVNVPSRDRVAFNGRDHTLVLDDSAISSYDANGRRVATR